MNEKPERQLPEDFKSLPPDFNMAKAIASDTYLGAVDLDGRDFELTITSVIRGPVFNPRTNKKTIQDAVGFKEARKLLLLNKTKTRQIISLHGEKVEGWIGKKVTLYPTTCNTRGEITPCVRIRTPKPV